MKRKSNNDKNNQSSIPFSHWNILIVYIEIFRYLLQKSQLIKPHVVSKIKIFNQCITNLVNSSFSKFCRASLHLSQNYVHAFNFKCCHITIDYHQDPNSLFPFVKHRRCNCFGLSSVIMQVLSFKSIKSFILTLFASKHPGISIYLVYLCKSKCKSTNFLCSLVRA